MTFMKGCKADVANFVHSRIRQSGRALALLSQKGECEERLCIPKHCEGNDPR